jgi:ribose 5-phosphate isomerase B
MSRKPIAIASDHAGYDLKTLLSQELAEMGYQVLDLGTDGPQSVDYPDFGAALAKVIQSGEVACGVLVCGTGIGMAMAANRHPGVRAAVCWDETSARLTREHNDANVLALGARLLGPEVAKDCLRAFLRTDFAGGRHAGRVAKLG